MSHGTGAGTHAESGPNHPGCRDIFPGASSAGIARIALAGAIASLAACAAARASVDAAPETPLPLAEQGGAGSATITATGSSFVPASTIDWNGAALGTTYVSA